MTLHDLTIGVASGVIAVVGLTRTADVDAGVVTCKTAITQIPSHLQYLRLQLTIRAPGSRDLSNTLKGATAVPAVLYLAKILGIKILDMLGELH